MDRQLVVEEMELARLGFHRTLDSATTDELRRTTDGTRWTNEQLLFHMLFGYLLVRVLLVLVRTFGRLPRAASKVFAAVLNSVTRPFHFVNYLGSLGGAKILGHAGMEWAFDRVVASLQRRLLRESDVSLTRGMHFPVDWDPFFSDYMNLADVYHYPTQHYEFHRRQLTLQDR